MLKSLSIRNYALIRQLEILPSEKMNIITGETGAGKSIMIGAVGLLLGNRADTKVLYDQDQKCIIEGVFGIKNYDLKETFENNALDYNPETIIRREIAPGGKSRAFINDTPVNLDVMRLVGSALMEIHSQNDTLKLGSNDFQLFIIDAFARNKDLLLKYKNHYREYRVALEELNALLTHAETARKEADYNQFMYDELLKAGLAGHEQESLEEEMGTLEHSEEIKAKLSEAAGILDTREFSVNESLGMIHKSLEQVSGYSHTLRELYERLNNCFVELKDLAGEISRYSDSVESDPRRLNEVTERLNMIYRLQQKHHVSTITDLIRIRDELEAKVAFTNNLDDEIENKKEAVEKLLQRVKKTGEELSEKRTRIFMEITEQLQTMLKDLGIPDARLQIGHSLTEPGSDGIDAVSILFSANKGVNPKALKDVASGGEFSRLMFTIKYLIAKSIALPTLVLDEIDAGISGEIAFKMSKMMKVMAEHHQVIAITHLPQIAASGDSHYYVFKDNSSDKSVSRIKKIEDDERILEIARMIGGDDPSQAALKSAGELLEKNR